MSKSMVHFLLVFDHAKGELVSQEQFREAPRAADAYSAAEQKYRDEKDLEIVLVGADSIETIQITHGQYFSASPFASKYLSLT
ncbi:Hypothetical protein KLENKIAIHU_439 [Klenkia terrae]|jgi:hypothetical protein|nr:hypothetical protein [Klenkia terrae]SSC21864.1 Hypothetical protein KLENKIAIHU_439 [Klenkia terrae]